MASVSLGTFQSSFEFNVTEAGTVHNLLPCTTQSQYKTQSFVRKGIQWNGKTWLQPGADFICSWELDMLTYHGRQALCDFTAM